MVVLLAGLAVAYQGQFALRQTRWGYATGRAGYEPGQGDEFLDHLWARELGQRYGREVVYLVHPSAKRQIHFDFYLDAQRVIQRHLGFVGRPEGMRRVLLVDRRGLSAREEEALERLARRHSAWVWGRRFVAIEETGEARGHESFVAVEDPAPWWWGWLVNERHPPTRWVPVAGSTSDRAARLP